MQIYDDLVLSFLPSLAKHLRRLGIDLKAFCNQWFLLVFVKCLPLETVLRVWDCFFTEGFVVRPLCTCRFTYPTCVGSACSPVSSHTHQ